MMKVLGLEEETDVGKVMKYGIFKRIEGEGEVMTEENWDEAN